eukprot:jgi/Hompol1/5136/HPOL_000841-RA
MFRFGRAAVAANSAAPAFALTSAWMPLSFSSIVPQQLPMMAMQSRGFKKHMNETFSISAGRSVAVKGVSVSQAFFKLRQILAESNFRALVRSQQRFESNPDRRRRLRKERDWAHYMVHVRRQAKQAVDLARRTKQEQQFYKEI